MARHLAVIGGIAAGLSAASRARKLDNELRITVFERGPVVSYGACGLPYWIEGQVENREQLVVHSPEFFLENRRISVEVNTEVLEIAHARRRLLLADGREVPYDRLVIATGATARVPAIDGLDAPHCFPAQTWEHFGRLQAFLKERNPKHAVVIGGGFIGLEMAEALHARGLKVTVLNLEQHVLRWHEDWLTERIGQRMADAGVRLHLGYGAQRIHEDKVDEIPADLVVVATGIEPNTAVAAAAGVRLGRNGAIAVDEFLETSLSGVFAAGDCAETHHRISNSPDWIPLGTTANKMGLVAGANAAGAKERFPGVVGTSIVRVCGMAVATTGLSPAMARSQGFRPVQARITARARPKYFDGKQVEVELVAHHPTGRLLGAAIVGEEEVEGRVNVMATAIAAGLSADDLLFTDLCYAPPYATVWDPLLIAARQLQNALDAAG
jgi:CoA-dependent NAD(P)H sulfur oxidoreductase